MSESIEVFMHSWMLLCCETVNFGDFGGSVQVIAQEPSFVADLEALKMTARLRGY